MYRLHNQLFKYNINRKSFVESKRSIDFTHLRRANEYVSTTKSTIDEVTWNDMNMDDVFGNINYANSSAGEETLYSWLRNPLDNKSMIEARLKRIHSAENKKRDTELLVDELRKLSYCRYHLKEIMESNFKANRKQLVLHSLISLVNLFIIMYSIMIEVSFLTGLLVLLFPINIFLHFSFNEKYGRQLEVLQYAMKMVKFCKVSSSGISEAFPELCKKVIELTNSLSSISKKEVSLFRLEGLDLVADYINVTFLIKEISYFSISGKVQDLKEEIVELYDCIGLMDATISIIRYKESLDYYCEPKLGGSFQNIVVEDLYHPLLNEPVSNSIEISEDIVITGSNMSGKSTFLRTIGINALFAQSICICLAKKYEADFYRLITSISLNDTILESKSYFLMEAEAMKRMLSIKNDDYSTLILIDEIFKGTNPIERYAASIEILNELGNGNTKVVVSTHDLNILPELENYNFYYFTENITSESLAFDFKIRKGTSKTRNAVKILEHVKYPKELVAEINSRISVMEDKSISTTKSC